MTAIPNTERRFSVDIPQWNRLDEKLTLLFLATMFVAVYGTAFVLISTMIPPPADNRQGLAPIIGGIILVSTGIRYFLNTAPYFFTRAYVVCQDALRVEYLRKTLMIPWEKIARLEPIDLGLPASPQKSALRIALSEPVGTQTSIDVFPADQRSFVEAVAACCPRLGPRDSVLRPGGDSSSGESFDLQWDRCDTVSFYLPLVLQAALLVLFGPIYLPAVFWFLINDAASRSGGSAGIRSAVLIALIPVVGAMSLLTAFLSVALRRRMSLVRRYVLNDDRLILECAASSLSIPFDAIYEIQPSKIARLLGFSLKPGYRVKYSLAGNRVSAIDVCPRDADRFLEALNARCPHLIQDGARWHSVSDSAEQASGATSVHQ